MTPRLVLLVVDRIYKKTTRHLQKLQKFLSEEDRLVVAVVAGFSEEERPILSVEVIVGTPEVIADVAGRLCPKNGRMVVVAMNESGLVPALAVQLLLGQSRRAGILESCDKSLTRQLLRQHQTLGVPFYVSSPGEPLPLSPPFIASKYVVKPILGMSSADVKILPTWESVRIHCAGDARRWLPDHLGRLVSPRLERSDLRIIEPFIEGTEFSVDGFIADDTFQAVVQQKLSLAHLQ